MLFGIHHRGHRVYREDREREKVLQELHPYIGEHGFGMELHALHPQGPVAQAHDDAVRFRGDFQIGRHRFFLNDQRVVARRHKILRQILEDRFVVVMNAAGFAVHDLRRADDLPPERVSDGLMAEAHAEDRNLPREAPDHVDANARIFRRAGPGRNHDALRLFCGNLVECNLVVAMHFQLLAQLAEELREVISERIVVVEK